MNDARPDHLTWRHLALALLLLAGAGALVWRLVVIQVLEHERYRDEAALLHYGATEVPAPRGAIISANGYPLATSIDTWDVYLDRSRWDDHESATEAARGLAAYLEPGAEAIYALGTEEEDGTVLLARDIDYGTGLLIEESGLAGVRLTPSSVRVHPEGDIAGQLIGHVGLDDRGLWGIEADYDHVLRGRTGIVYTERDVLGRPIAFGVRREHPPERGGDVVLTIDAVIQRIAEQELARALEEYEAPSGSIVVMDPHSGAVLAIASRPAVRLTDIDLDAPELSRLVRNRPVTDLYEPGSVLKTLTTAAALDLGRITPQSTYVDEGAVEVGGYTIRNWDFQAYGEVTVTEYLQRSLNTGAVWLSERIGARPFYDYLLAFGLGEPTHIGLSGEAEGLVRTPDDPDWYESDRATNSFGQGIAATPLQVLTAVNTFANGGMLMRPYVVSEIVTPAEVRRFEPVAVRRVVSPQTARGMARLMFDVVETSLYSAARVDGYHVAGKTGTTLVSIPTGYDLDTTIASFAGFIPYESPRVSVLVKVDQPGGQFNLGGQVAAPLFSRVAGRLMEYLRVPSSAGLVASP
ncbi:MAG: penicillin-binding protein 2 [Chloroflexi bacterium]|nr:penicillin-binding protein 2 [Chloroflexota bacterium]